MVLWHVSMETYKNVYNVAGLHKGRHRLLCREAYLLHCWQPGHWL